MSQTSEYALRAALYLAQHGEAGPVKLEQIASAIDVPRNYLSKTLHQLSRAGVLSSERGPNGGFRLGRPPELLSLADVVGPFDPVRLSRRCLLGEGECSDASPCAAHALWKPVADPMRAFFRATTVADLLRGTAPLPAGDSGAG